MKKKYLLFFLIICMFFFGGCATPIARLKNSVVNGKAKDHPIEISCCQEDVEITYLGASGFLIERDGFAVLTAPFFSNPTIPAILGPIYPKKEEIDRGLENTSLNNVKAILVGHAHYDHLMDVPYVVKKIKEQNPVAKLNIYGSETMKNLLLNKKRIKREIEAGREDPMDSKNINIVALNQKAASFWSPGDWVCFDKEGEIACTGQNIIFRFMAINSEHAPHFAGFKFFSGVVDSTEGPPAKTGADWKEGRTFAYVMDFLGSDNTVDLRLHFQDATSNPPAGFLPIMKPVNRTDRVDIAIVCVAAYSQVENYPEGIIRNLKPRHIIMSHWENFFKPLPLTYEKLEVVPGTDVDKFIHRMEKVMPQGAKWTFPIPGSKISYEGD